MAQPPNYTPKTSFAEDEGAQVTGRSLVRTAALDTEFSDIESTLDAALTNLALIQRDDGELADGVVKAHTLSNGIIKVIGGSWNPRGDWAAGVAYQAKDVVEQGGIAYVAVTPHIASSDFQTDYDAGKWLTISVAASLIQQATDSANSAGRSATQAGQSAAAADAAQNNAYGYADDASASATQASSDATQASSDATQAKMAWDALQGQYYGPLADDPGVDPLGNLPDKGDSYYNTGTTIPGLRFFDGTSWKAALTASSLIQAFAQSETNEAAAGAIGVIEHIADYAALRALTRGAGQQAVYVYSEGLAGVFRFDAFDAASADDGGTIIVGADGARWKRQLGQNILPEWFGAEGGGMDDTTAVQAALDFATSVGKTLYLSQFFSISSSIKPNKALDPDNPVDRISISAPPCGISYNKVGMIGGLIALSGFAADTALIDMRACIDTAIENLGLSCVAGVRGIEYGWRVVGYQFRRHRLANSSIHGGDYGVYSKRGSAFKIQGNNISGHTSAGLGLLLGGGDSDIRHNRVNTNNTDYVGTDNTKGVGIHLGPYSANTNIYGGKVEWNATGILLNGCYGITVSHINFDVNRWSHIAVNSLNGTDQAARSIVISSNRFLAGGTTTGNNKAHILLNSGIYSLYTTITGNDFKKGGDLAFDYNTGPNIGPATYGISATASSGGECRVLITGNNLLGCSNANTFGAYGPGIRLSASNNLIDLPSYIDSGAVFESASVTQTGTTAKDAANFTAVSFPKAFVSPPAIAASFVYGGTSAFVTGIMLQNITNTGFEFAFISNDGTLSTDTSNSIVWTATGN